MEDEPNYRIESDGQIIDSQQAVSLVLISTLATYWPEFAEYVLNPAYENVKHLVDTPNRRRRHRERLKKEKNLD